MDQRFGKFDICPILEKHCFKYLPAKSLGRLQCVSKSWREKISGEEFQVEQSKTFTTISAYFLQDPRAFTMEAKKVFLSLDPNAFGIPDPSLSFFRGDVGIKASSAGMLLLRDADRNTNVGEKWYYICYPLRSFTQKIPQPVLNHGENPKVILIAATGSEFQVVCAFTHRRFHLISTYFDLFDSEIKKWRVLQRVLEIKVEYGVYCQGITYWMLTNEPNKILAVDIKNGEVSYIHTALLERSTLIALLNKQLAIINITHHDEESFKLYTYDRENESWECFYTIDLSSCYGFFHPLRLLHAEDTGILYQAEEFIYKFDLYTNMITCVAKVDDFSPLALNRKNIFSYVNRYVPIGLF